ncbi:OmpA family protein [bacterium]|nr:OmpA family protein [bacterium]
MKKNLLLLSCLFFLPSQVQAFGTDEAGTSAALLLAQPASSRLLAMGGAGTAAAVGVQALDWNPAALTYYDYLNAELSFCRHLLDTELGFFRAAWPLSWGVPALSLTYAQTSDIHGYDSFDNPTGSFATRDMDVSLVWGQMIGAVALGLALHYIFQDLHTAQVRGWGLDLGADWEIAPDLRIGAALLHWGQTDSGDPLSFEIRTGAGLVLFSNLNLALDIVLPRDRNFYLGSGVEWNVFEFLAVRAGWHNGPADTAKLAEISWFTTGIGFKWKDYYLDYVFEPGGFIGDAHFITLGYRYHPPPAEPRELSEKISSPASLPAVHPRPVAPESREKLPARSNDFQMIFMPKPIDQNYQVKELHFKIKDSEGNVRREFSYAHQAIPRQLAWDGLDAEGRPVNPDGLVYQFEYLTDRGLITQTQTWPRVLPATKLCFEKKGEGIEPGVLFQFKGDVKKINSWILNIEEDRGKQVNTIKQPGPLPARQLWDGRDEQGAFADPSQHYAYQLHMADCEGSRIIIRKTIIPLSAEFLSCDSKQVRFKIGGIIFDFKKADIQPEMLPQLEKVLEIYHKYGSQSRVAIEGHADSIGRKWGNYNISCRRAENIKKYLRQHGIPYSWKIATQGRGAENLLVKSSVSQKQAKNRRGEIIFAIPSPVEK